MNMVDHLELATSSDDDEVFIVRELVRALDDEIDALKPWTTTRLAQARLEAVERGRRSPKRLSSRFDRSHFALAGMAASVALVTLLTVVTPLDSTPTAPIIAGSTAIEGMPIVSGTEDFDFYESIDFLLWLEERRA